MIRVPWTEEEAVALFDFYFREGINAPIEKIKQLSLIYNIRAQQLGLTVDEKFRNTHGIKIQLACVHYVVTEGQEGMSNVSKLFYDTYDLYRNCREHFDQILAKFRASYSI